MIESAFVSDVRCRGLQVTGYLPNSVSISPPNLTASNHRQIPRSNYSASQLVAIPSLSSKHGFESRFYADVTRQFMIWTC